MRTMYHHHGVIFGPSSQPASRLASRPPLELIPRLIIDRVGVHLVGQPPLSVCLSLRSGRKLRRPNEWAPPLGSVRPAAGLNHRHLPVLVLRQARQDVAVVVPHQSEGLRDVKVFQDCPVVVDERSVRPVCLFVRWAQVWLVSLVWVLLELQVPWWSSPWLWSPSPWLPPPSSAPQSSSATSSTSAAIEVIVSRAEQLRRQRGHTLAL